MGSQTYLLSDEMTRIAQQIKELNLSYMVNHRFLFRTFNVISGTPYRSIYDSYQYVEFDFVIGYDIDFRLILDSQGNEIRIQKIDKDEICWKSEYPSMEYFMENITPDLAEVLYFNIDLWSKNNC